MNPYKRSVRVADLLREEISLIVMRRIKDPRLGFVTVTAVKVTDDLKLARVYISVMDKKNAESSLEVLTSAKGFIRSELSKTVKLKYIPQLEFFKDESIEYGERIDKLLDEIKDRE
ncbi:MAG: 30S ribosome-binding factor RbfA [Nitrospirota bacterium]|nr:MAG: 30S ribosome-binding factor RbfA [Nitrospirota bacterium]